MIVIRNAKICVLFILCVIVFGLAARADAEIRPGIRMGGYFDASGASVGGELLTGLGPESWYFNPNVEYVFADRSQLVTFNFDVHYDLPAGRTYYLWVGGGPAILFSNPDNVRLKNQTDFGVNLLMGVGFNRGGHVIPYIQPKVILSDHSDFAIAFGLRF